MKKIIVKKEIRTSCKWFSYMKTMTPNTIPISASHPRESKKQAPIPVFYGPPVSHILTHEKKIVKKNIRAS